MTTEMVACQTLYVPSSHKWLSFLKFALQDVRVLTDGELSEAGADYYLEPGLEITVPDSAILIKELQESPLGRRTRYLRAGTVVSPANDNILGPSPWYPSLGRLKHAPIPIVWQTTTPKFDLCIVTMRPDRGLNLLVDMLRADGINTCGPFTLSPELIRHVQSSKFSLLYHGVYHPTPIGPEFSVLASLCSPMMVDFPATDNLGEPLPNLANLVTDIITYDPRDLDRLNTMIHGHIHQWPQRMLATLPLAYSLIEHSVFESPDRSVKS